MSAFKVLPLKFESLYQNRENSRYKNLGITGLLSLAHKKAPADFKQGLSIIWHHFE
ncbi:hypothetical protein [Vibrio atlanticus]|uniref:hypothetical protein n=1 Tax=Vibrio atlanticus TaxID=693153 RepID=UPI0013C526C8|nr:hypothetical protein [Vibrio atlanticus]